MDCGYFENLIERMPEEPLSPEESAALNEHLSRCAECRALQEAYAFLSQDLSELEEAPETLLSGVMDAVWAENRKRMKSIKRRRFAGWATAAACVALAVGVGFPLFAPKGGSSADFAMPAAMEYEAAPQAVAEEAPAEEAVMESRSVVAEAPMEPRIASLTGGDEAPAAYSEDGSAGNTQAEAGLGMDESIPMAAALLPASDAAPLDDLPAAEAAAAAEAPPAAASSAAEAPEAERAEPMEAPLPEPTAAPADIDSLLAAICVPGGESLPLTEYEMQYRFEHNGLVYEFLLWDGRLWWRSDNASLPSLSPAGEAELFALMN